MANSQMTITKVVDGSRFSILHIYIKGDGSGEITNEVIADPATFNPPLAHKPCFSILELDYELSGFDARLVWDSTPDQPAWNIPQASSNNTISFRHMGGLFDHSGLDGTGKLLLSTSGLSNGEQGSLIVTLKKRSQ